MFDVQAAHGRHCGSRTFPMRCKFCGEDVFYFTCNHGCKVFFNELGWPWPLHRCTEYQMYQFLGADLYPTYLEIQAGTMTGQAARQKVERWLADQMHGLIDERYAERVSSAAKPKSAQNKSQSRQILAQPPYKPRQTMEDMGMIREMIPTVDLLKRFKLPDTQGSWAMLKPVLPDKKYLQLTVHTGALGEDDIDSFTFLAPENLVRKAGIITEDLLYFKLRSVQLPNQNPIWVCESIYRP